MLNLGLGLGLGGRAGGSSVFNPATLALTGWWGPTAYTASPWTPTASAGTSGTNGDLAEGSNAPTADNGAASFDGTNDILTSAATIADLFNATAYTIVQLAYVDAFALADPGAGQPYNCPGGLGNHAGDGAPVGGFAGSGASGVWRFGHSDGAFKSAAVAVTTGAWIMVATTYNGTNISASLNAGAPVTAAAGSAASMAGFGIIGRNYLGAQFADIKVREIMTSDVDLSASLSDIKSYFNSTYSLSL